MRAITEAGAVVARRRARAFSLLELVIALAIVAVVAAYAVPAYVRHAARGHRIAVVTALYRAAQFLEASADRQIRPGDAQLPAGLDRVPPHGSAVYRLLVMRGGFENGSYVLEARPVESGPMGDDACGTFVLDATGKRSNRATATRAPPDTDCWSGR
jgi:type IV pilus assembly protein PilE